MPKFGDTAADHAAQQIIGDHFPNRDIVPLQIDNIAAGGGGIHRSTHDHPGTPATPDARTMPASPALLPDEALCD